MIQSEKVHKNLVTALFYQNNYLLVGSRDCRISIWHGNSTFDFLKFVNGHHNTIIAISLSVASNLMVSSDYGGLILMHTLEGQ